MLCHRLDGGAIIPQGLDPKVVEVYQAVGKIMSRFTAGKVPKAFKVIPNLQNWEEILFLTDPEKWSPHAVYQATRLFISNLNAKMVRIIFEACHRPPTCSLPSLMPKGHQKMIKAVNSSTAWPVASA